jgi:lysophospholipase L1-like esterase
MGRNKMCEKDIFEKEPAKMIESSCTYLTKEMYERATAYKEGNLTRIAKAMRKAAAGEKVTIGVIGGSITQGCLATKQDYCYASLLKKWWEDTFPMAKIEFINAGIGATNSYLGVHRVYKDLLSYKPDFVVVEFSVNDSNNSFFKKSYENLVRRILKDNNNPAVLLLFMTMEDGTSAEENDSAIGVQYDLPMISYRKAVLEEIHKNHFTWKDISPDDIHPNDRGHAIVGELLSVFLTDIYHRLDSIPVKVTPFDKSALTNEAYADGAIFDSKTIEPVRSGSFMKKGINSNFPNGWYTTDGKESIVFSVKAANIGILYQKFTNGTGGRYEVYVDGQLTSTLDADFTNGWGDYPESTEVFASGERKTHTLEIRKKEDSAKTVFAILGLLIS